MASAAILPHLEHKDLYERFHLDEPWDSENNKKLIAEMPSEYKYAYNKLALEGKTVYLTVCGEKTMFPAARA